MEPLPLHGPDSEPELSIYEALERLGLSRVPRIREEIQARWREVISNVSRKQRHPITHARDVVLDHCPQKNMIVRNKYRHTRNQK